MKHTPPVKFFPIKWFEPKSEAPIRMDFFKGSMYDLELGNAATLRSKNLMEADALILFGEEIVCPWKSPEQYDKGFNETPTRAL